MSLSFAASIIHTKSAIKSMHILNLLIDLPPQERLIPMRDKMDDLRWSWVGRRIPGEIKGTISFSDSSHLS